MARSPPRPSQLDLGEAVPNHSAGAARCARRSGGCHSRFPNAVRKRSGSRWFAGSGSRGRGGPGARVCVCWEGGPPRCRRSASPSPGAHGPSPSPEAARAAAEQPRLRLPRYVSCRPPSPGRAPGAAAERLPAGELLRARTGAGGGGPVLRGCAGERRARRRGPPSQDLLARSPPPALRSLPPLLGVIDPSRAPPLPPRPF